MASRRTASKLFYRHRLAVKHQGFIITNRTACPATRTPFTIDTRSFTGFTADGFGGTHRYTFSASDTEGLKKTDLRAWGDTFRIAAPLAFEAASFQKHHSPDARSVMDRISLYIGYQGGH
jgi:hypothetical protein